MKDIFDKIKNNRGPLGQHAKESHGYFTFPKLEGEIAPRMRFKGKEVLTWSINNYLGLSNHPGFPLNSNNLKSPISKFEVFKILHLSSFILDQSILL